MSLEKMTDIYLRVNRAAKNASGQVSPRNEQGEFEDFLEKRRPFMHPNPTGHSH